MTQVEMYEHLDKYKGKWFNKFDLEKKLKVSVNCVYRSMGKLGTRKEVETKYIKFNVPRQNGLRSLKHIRIIKMEENKNV